MRFRANALEDACRAPHMTHTVRDALCAKWGTNANERAVQLRV